MEGENIFKGLMINSELFGGVEEGMTWGNHLIEDTLALGLLEMAAVILLPQ